MPECPEAGPEICGCDPPPGSPGLFVERSYRQPAELWPEDHGLFISWGGSDLPAKVLAVHSGSGTVDLRISHPGPDSGWQDVPGIPVGTPQTEAHYRTDRRIRIGMMIRHRAAAVAEWDRPVPTPVYSLGRLWAADTDLVAPAEILRQEGSTAIIKTTYVTVAGERKRHNVPVLSDRELASWLIRHQRWIEILSRHMAAAEAEWQEYTKGHGPY